MESLQRHGQISDTEGVQHLLLRWDQTHFRCAFRSDSHLTDAAYVKYYKRRGRTAEVTHWNSSRSVCSWQPRVSFLSLTNTHTNTTQHVFTNRSHLSDCGTQNPFRDTLRKKWMLHEGVKVKREAYLTGHIKHKTRRECWNTRHNIKKSNFYVHFLFSYFLVLHYKGP